MLASPNPASRCRPVRTDLGPDVVELPWEFQEQFELGPVGRLADIGQADVIGNDDRGDIRTAAQDADRQSDAALLAIRSLNRIVFLHCASASDRRRFGLIHSAGSSRAKGCRAYAKQTIYPRSATPVRPDDRTPGPCLRAHRLVAIDRRRGGQCQFQLVFPYNLSENSNGPVRWEGWTEPCRLRWPIKTTQPAQINSGFEDLFRNELRCRRN
jgi:hypothetical protein